MYKNNLIRKISKQKSISIKEAKKQVDAVLGAISDALAQGEQVVIPDFGRFKIVNVPQHTAKNPATQETILVPEKDKVVFKPFARVLSYAIVH